MGEGDKSSMCF